MLHFFFLFIAGLVGGFLGGLLGIGGGIIYIVVIPVVLSSIGVPREELVQYTIANAVFASFFSSLSANYILLKTKSFYLQEVIIIGIFGVVSSLLVLHTIVNSSWYSKGSFNIIVILILSYIMLKTLLTAHKHPVESGQTEGKGLKLGLAGIASGAVSALSGLGGGVVIIPILNSFFKMDIRKANSISLGVIGITSLSISLSSMIETPSQSFHYYNLGYVIFPVALSLSAGVIIASPLGVKAARLTPTSFISYLFAFFLALVIIRKIIEVSAYPN